MFNEVSTHTDVTVGFPGFFATHIGNKLQRNTLATAINNHCNRLRGRCTDQFYKVSPAIDRLAVNGFNQVPLAYTATLRGAICQY